MLARKVAMQYFGSVLMVLKAALLMTNFVNGDIQLSLKEKIEKQVLGVVPRSLFEGDMLLDESLASQIKHSILTRYQTVRSRREVSREIWRKWKKGTVPFVFGKGIDHKRRKLIKKAVRLFNKKTCINLVPRTSEKDYVEFIFGIGCYSNIGRQGGKQEVSLGKGCDTLSHVLHELMHTIGFLHEHSRNDRDKYIKVHWRNILPGKEVHFVPYSHGELDNLDAPYDITSIMHYSQRAFSMNGFPTITARNKPKVQLGGKTLSDIDIKQINWLYKCRNKHYIKCIDKHRHCRKVRKHPKYCIALRQVMAQFCPASCHFC